MEIGEFRGIPDLRSGLLSADRITQVDNTGHAVTKLDVDQIVSGVMRSFEANHG
jgi:C-terminal processing protease CtpA/Prc